MPTLDASDLNIVLSILGIFIILYGFVSVKLKQVWYLGVALPAMVIGIVLGPVAAKFIDSTRWGSAAAGQQSEITIGLTRVMIGVQLAIAGFQLPARYQLSRFKEMFLCLVPVMTMMWLCTTLCIFATVPNLTVIAAMVIGACVTSTDPILSQAIAKGPFADQFVRRPLREIISSEAGANDGFGFTFLLLSVYLMRHVEIPAVEGQMEGLDPLEGFDKREEEVGRMGGGLSVALQSWFLEVCLYMICLSIAYGAVVGYGGGKILRFALRRKWVDAESYLLFPTALGLFLVGTGGALGTDDVLACFVAGNALNWDGEYLAECQRRRDEVNNCIDMLLNFGGFMYIGSILPWEEFNQPEVTGLTIPSLLGLGVLVLLFRRIPAILATYKLMPNVCGDYKEALFMGYFGPIGAGAVFYAEHTRTLLLPSLDEGDEGERNLKRAIIPVVYWLVFFSIVVHGLSIPVLDLIYRWRGVRPITEDAVKVQRKSMFAATPANAVEGEGDTIIAYNRFSRPTIDAAELPVFREAPTLEKQGVERFSFGDAMDIVELEKQRAAHQKSRQSQRRRTHFW